MWKQSNSKATLNFDKKLLNSNYVTSKENQRKIIIILEEKDLLT